MASKPDERRCFIDYLPSLLLLWGLLFFMQEAAAQEPDLQVEIIDVGDCPSVDENSMTTYQVKVTNVGGHLDTGWTILGPFVPIIYLDILVPQGTQVFSPGERGNVISFSVQREILKGQVYDEEFVLQGPFAGDLVAEVRFFYSNGLIDLSQGEDWSSLPILSQPSSGSINAEQIICRNSVPKRIGDSGKNLAAPGAEVSFRWWAKAKSAPEIDEYKLLLETKESTYVPDALLEDTYFYRTTVATINEDSEEIRSCESAPTSKLLISTKICQVASNPMMRMQALEPVEE